MAHIPGTQTQQTYAAAAHFVEQGLVNPGSLFTPDLPVWTPDTLADLHQRHVTANDTSGGFAERWARRLAGAPAATVRLAAELAFVHVLFAADLKHESKRRLITATLGRSSDSPHLPPALDAALDRGLAGTGVAFKLRRMSQLGLLITAAFQWWQLPDLDRKAALSSPWAFKLWLFSLPVDGAFAQREALLH
ncbi:MAG: AAA family ATPase, partial [Egibacteraceae bacterium]